MPLQSGNSTSADSAWAAGSSYFFIQFRRAVFQKKLADSRIIHIKLVYLHQSYHIIGVFYNAPLMTVFDRMAFEREQVPKRDNFCARGAGGCRHRLGQELCKRIVADEHQIERQGP